MTRLASLLLNNQETMPINTSSNTSRNTNYRDVSLIPALIRIICCIIYNYTSRVKTVSGLHGDYKPTTTNIKANSFSARLKVFRFVFFLKLKNQYSATSLNQEDEGDDMSIGMEAQTYASYES